MTTIFLAVAIGATFGFVLDRVGATNPGLIIRMLNLSDMHLMRTILTGIGVASLLMFSGIMAGTVDPGHMSVKTAYIGVFVGGLLLGIGFAVSGFCPGTGLTAAATGRKDAMFFVAGGLLGAAAYMASYPWVVSTGILEEIAGGKTTLAKVTGTDYPALFATPSGEIAGIAVGIALIAIAALLPRRLTAKAKVAPAG